MHPTSVITDVLTESMSDDHLKVISALEEPKRDVDLAEELEIEDTQIRVILNDLHKAKLVKYTRDKNETTGWVTHYWIMREDQLDDYTRGYLQTKIDTLNRYLDEAATAIKFTCNCAIIGYEQAIDEGFQCNSCGKPYMEYNNPEEIEEKVAELTRLTSLLNKT